MHLRFSTCNRDWIRKHTNAVMLTHWLVSITISRCSSSSPLLMCVWQPTHTGLNPIPNIFVLYSPSSALLSDYSCLAHYRIAMPATEVETPSVSYCALICLILTLTIAFFRFSNRHPLWHVLCYWREVSLSNINADYCPKYRFFMTSW